MPKFYVSCGSHTLTIEAPTAKCAATRMLDELMAPHAWMYDDSSLDDQTRRDHIVFEALLHLGTTVDVSEKGLNRNEAGMFGVPELLDEWHRLMISISRLLVAAGIDAKRVLPSAPRRSNSSNVLPR